MVRKTKFRIHIGKRPIKAAINKKGLFRLLHILKLETRTYHHVQLRLWRCESNEELRALRLDFLRLMQER